MNIDLTKEGFLKDYNAWNKNIADYIAGKNNIELTAEHWLIINFLRDFYQEYEYAPAIRTLLTLLKNNNYVNLASSSKLAKLFPPSPAVMAAKIAGLPKPKKCL